ncbi:Rhodanese domain-containing protein [Entamoeba marina]
MQTQVEYVDDEQLISWIKDKVTKIQIIDVRGSDVNGLVIHGAINYPVSVFKESIDQILDKYHSYDYIIVHCMRSQQRGPRCAEFLKRRFYSSKYYATSNVQIVILEGGFGRFYNKHFNEPELFDEVQE